MERPKPERGVGRRYNDGRAIATGLILLIIAVGVLGNSGGAIHLLPAHAADIDTTERVSVDSNGFQGNSNSGSSSISTDGHYVIFRSSASNLVTGDTNGYGDVFVRDRLTGATERVSVDSNGIQGNSNSGSTSPSISADGRYVAFESSASNLVAGDTNGYGDVFVRDRSNGATERVSVDSSGAQGNSDSSESRYSGSSSISADGRFVAFSSSANNLVAGDTNGYGDVFVRDRLTAVTERVSVDSNGVEGNANSDSSSISGDGRHAAFESSASNLVAGDTNGYGDVFARDRLTGVTERVSVDSNGIQGNANSGSSSISADGRYVDFSSHAGNLVTGDTNGYADVFVRDRSNGTTERVSVDSNGVQGNAASLNSSLSADGRYVAFSSSASNIIAVDTNGHGDVFVRDRSTGATERVSVDSNGVQGNARSGSDSISADGRFVAFSSSADNLVAGDTNGYGDVFVRGERCIPPDADSDCDGSLNGTDNCPIVANPDQLNTDEAPLTTASAPNEKTRPNGDALGDACDPDDDNDGLSDEVELQLGVPSPPGPCTAATAATDPLLQDTDGDRVIDGAECALGSDPADAGSKPLACAVLALPDADGDRLCDGFEVGIGSDPNVADTDGDGINDGVEYRGYGTSPLAVDSDLDGCGDGMEIASVDTNTIVNSNDLLVVALQFGAGDRPVQDVDRNGIVNSSDLLMVALRFGELC